LTAGPPGSYNRIVPTDLAALLVNEGAVAGATLEQALARQAELGGALDTALLELGVDEAVLVGALARATELPPAPESAWEAADARARRVFPSRVAERHGLAPFALDGRELSLVAAYPVDLGLLDEISFMLSLHLTAHVGLEWRVRVLIHRLYGGALDPRLAKLADGRGGVAPPVELAPRTGATHPGRAGEDEADGEPEPRAEAEKEKEAPAERSSDGPGAQAEPDPLRTPLVQFGLDEGEPLEPLAAALAQALESEDMRWLDDAVKDLGPGAASAAETAEPPPDRTAPPRWKLAEARAALAAARNRDEVVLVALRYARDFFQFAALFAVTRDAVAGYDALGVEEDARDRCRGTAIYTSDPGIFRTVIDTRAPYLGPVAGGQSGNEAILSGLGRATPRTVLVCPMVLRDRTVCVLYADNGEAPVSARRLGDLLLLLATLGNAFERLIRARKEQRLAGHGAIAPSAAGAKASPPGATARPAPATAKPGPAKPAAGGRGAETKPVPAPATQADAAPALAPQTASAPAAAPIPSPAAPQPRPAADPWRTREPGLAGLPEFDIDVDEPEQDDEPASPENEIARLIRTAAGSPRRAESIARLAAHGDEAVPALVHALPGPLDDEQAQEPARLGPVPAALALHGASALPMLLAVLQEADPARRRCAAVLLGFAAEQAAFGPLADRALDPDPRVAAAAAVALARNRTHPAMRSVPDKLRRALLSGIAARVTGAARALGALRDLESIPLLVQVLETSAGEAADAASEALTRITLQRIGPDPRKWLAWWKDNRGHGRAEWLFSGLTSPDRAVRAAAAAELSEAAPSPVQYDPDASPTERAAAARAWAAWWSRSGRVL
jgi:HEAT repeat protein